MTYSQHVHGHQGKDGMTDRMSSVQGELSQKVKGCRTRQTMNLVVMVASTMQHFMVGAMEEEPMQDCVAVIIADSLASLKQWVLIGYRQVTSTLSRRM